MKEPEPPQVKPYSIFDRPPDYGEEEDSDMNKDVEAEKQLDVKIAELRADIHKKDVNLFNNSTKNKKPTRQGKIIDAFK